MSVIIIMAIVLKILKLCKPTISLLIIMLHQSSLHFLILTFWKMGHLSVSRSGHYPPFDAFNE